MTPEQASPLAVQVWLMLGEAFTTQDAAAGGIALAVLDAALAPLVPVDDIVRDEPDAPGWSRELDPVTTTRPRWAAQFTGDTPPAGLTDEQVRQRLSDRPHQRRGRAASIAAAARPLLTGTKLVDIFERDGSPYRIRFRTYTEQTPDPAAVAAALEAAKPGGLLLTHEVVDLTAYTAIEDDPPITYGELEAEPALTYSQMEA